MIGSISDGASKQLSELRAFAASLADSAEQIRLVAQLRQDVEQERRGVRRQIFMRRLEGGGSRVLYLLHSLFARAL